MSTWRKLPDATMTRVDVFEGEAPEFEESRREFHLIEERRVKEVTRIFEDHGLVITWPSK
jgi:acyl carrier protein phosphodiesterase